MVWMFFALSFLDGRCYQVCMDELGSPGRAKGKSCLCLVEIPLEDTGKVRLRARKSPPLNEDSGHVW